MKHGEIKFVSEELPFYSLEAFDFLFGLEKKLISTHSQNH